ncbi:MAG: DUF885 domain-containing protein [bacterium]
MRTLSGVMVMMLAGCGSSPAPESVVAPNTIESTGLPVTADTTVSALAAAMWTETMRVAPTWASYLGERDRDDELPDLSAAARAEHDRILGGIRRAARQVDPAELDARHRVIHAALLVELDGHFDEQARCGYDTWVVSQLHGPQSWLGELPAFHVVDGEQRARDLVTRYRAIPRLFAQQAESLREGLAAGRSSARINVERVIEQLDRLAATPVDDDPYLAPVRAQVATLAAPPYPGFDDELRAAVVEAVRPALAEYRKFLAEQVLPASRAEPGVAGLPAGGDFPDGAACYAAAIARHTGLSLDAEAIHRIGLEEVARIRGEMAAIVAEMGGGADVEGFLVALGERPEERFADEAALIAHNEALLARAQAKLPEAFGRLPKTPIEVKAIEAFRAPESPAAYYYSAPPDGSRPAYYYLNTHAPETRLRYKMPALAHHEAVPGHHLQIALAAEAEALPRFMQEMGNTAFVEGWALYAEKLAGELGLYPTPAERLGSLTYEIWRAARLVIDTGIHAKGWSRQQAIDYLARYTGHDLGEVQNEVDRYIAWPGQALAYKLGQMEISRLRAEAELKLGARFDLRAFHDRLLSMGALPLPVIRGEMERWMAEVAATAAR